MKRLPASLGYCIFYNRSNYLRPRRTQGLHGARHLTSSSNKGPFRKYNAYYGAPEHKCVCWEDPAWSRKRSGDFFCRRVVEEPLRQYRSGGYHPVHLGDTLHQGRYTIFGKLGYGKDATIWLANDSKLSRLVALKICRSGIQHESEAEAQSLERLRIGLGMEDHPGKRNIVQLLDRFEISGPNGRHLCLVLEVLGRMQEGLLLFESLEESPLILWQLSKQIIEGISYAHDMGVTHGSLSRDKIRYSSPNFSYKISDPANQPKKARVDLVQPVDSDANILPILGSTVTARVPHYLVYESSEITINGPSLNQFPLNDDIDVKIIGFGKVRMLKDVPGFEGEADECSGTDGWHNPVDFEEAYLAPEFLFGSNIGPSADIFSLGFLMREIMTRKRLMYSAQTKDYILWEYVPCLGELPEEWQNHKFPSDWNRYEKPGELEACAVLKSTYQDKRRGKKWFTKESLDSFAGLITSMTQWRPCDRPTAKQVLEHPWFQQEPSLLVFEGPTFKEAEALFPLFKALILRKLRCEGSSLSWRSERTFWVVLDVQMMSFMREHGWRPSTESLLHRMVDESPSNNRLSPHRLYFPSQPPPKH